MNFNYFYKDICKSSNYKNKIIKPLAKVLAIVTGIPISCCHGLKPVASDDKIKSSSFFIATG